MVKRSLVALSLAWALAAGGTALAAEPALFAARSEPGISFFISKPLGRTGGAPFVGLRLERMGPTAAPAGAGIVGVRSVAELAVLRLDGGEGDIDSSTESSVRLRPWVWASVIGMAAVLLILENNDDDDDVPAYEIPQSSGPG